MYIAVVLVVGRLVRGLVTNDPTSVIILEMPCVDRLLKVARLMCSCRNEFLRADLSRYLCGERGTRLLPGAGPLRTPDLPLPQSRHAHQVDATESQARLIVTPECCLRISLSTSSGWVILLSHTRCHVYSPSALLLLR